MQEIEILKVSSGTSSKKLASAIAHKLKENTKILISAIGVQAISQTTKAIAIAGGFVGVEGNKINVQIGFTEVKDKEDKLLTAIRYKLELQ